ncbi:MAG: hypothetical protein CMJ65_07640 [Planctomycetaceae bacterium]|nr:hypothetical protein [Planctomycetaceae bacterium]
MSRPILLAGLLASLVVTTATAPPARADDKRGIDYARQVKTIFRQRCWACHSALKQEAGLRLDASQLVRRGSDDGKILVAGQPEKSRLWLRLTDDLPERMPPEGKPLSAGELATLKAWITQGAPAPKFETPPIDPRQHWSFTPLQRPRVPNVKNREWIRNPVDGFVAFRHEAAGLAVRPEADRATLLRRVTLDLVGIPPTREQIREFLADNAPGAYQRVINRLLESPLHGQRWGRHWMDVWRYSDWYGRRPSNEIRYSQRHIWRWRDWIIESLNQGKGYDRMLHEMLAGDELAPADDATLRATGFLGRNWYKFDRNAWLFETVEKTSKGLLALTFRCARCHDHKFDPVSQEDYYRFRAFFEPHGFRTEVLSADVSREVDNGKSKVLSDGLSRVFDEKPEAATFLFIRGDDRNPDTSRKLAPGVPSALGDRSFKATPITPIELPAVAYIPALRPAEAARLTKVETDKVAVADKAMTDLQARILKTTSELDRARKDPATNTSGAKLVLSDSFKTLDKKAWTIVSGTWTAADDVLTESTVRPFATLVSTSNHPHNFRARLKYRTLAPGNPRSIGLSFDYVNAKQSQDVYTAINPNGNTPSVQAFHRTGGREVYPKAGIQRAPELKIGKDAVLEVTVVDRSLTVVVDGRTALEYTLPIQRRPGKFALWVHNGNAAFDELTIHAIRPTIKGLEQTLVVARRELPVKQAERNLARASLDSLRARLAAERARLADSDTAADIPRLAMAASKLERQIAVAQAKVALAKASLGLATAGNKPKPQHPAAVTAATAALEKATAARDAADGNYTRFKAAYPTRSTGRRTALARWLTHRDNPRTARVAINQIWMRHTGASFVNTVSDFGIRSQPRTFPDLMDWLSVELIESGWDMKHIHRLVVNSATYRLSSRLAPATGDNRKIDPDNSLLWRMNSHRMEAEVVRDSLLAASDALDPAFGGPDLPESQGQASRRRSLYFRTTPDNKMPLLELFNLANPNECYRRRESIIPQQALALTNSPLALDRSRHLARRLITDTVDRLGPPVGDSQATHTTSFITSAFETVLGRRPDSRELAACRAFLARQARLLDDPKTLRKFPAGSTAPVAASADPAIRARENLVHVLFSHNDFVTIR